MCCRVYPELKGKKMIPLRGQVSLDPFSGSGQCEAPDPQDDQDDVGEERRNVDDFAGSLDAFEETSSHKEPSAEEGSHRLNSRIALKKDTIFAKKFLLTSFLTDLVFAFFVLRNRITERRLEVTRFAFLNMEHDISH